MRFRYERIDNRPPSGRLSSCVTTDLTGNGRPDLIVSAMGDPYRVSLFGRSVPLRGKPFVGNFLKRFESNLFWYENPGWERHEMADVAQLDVGLAAGDITGDGRPNVVAGQGINFHNLYWFEPQDDPREKWTSHLITDDFEKYHDVIVADIDGDGEVEVAATSQESEVVFYYDVPDDPRCERWPESHRHVVADDIHVEGLQVADVDGDGDPELLAGPNVFHRRRDDVWERERIAEGWKWTRTAVGDIDGDGEIEVVLAEGDRPEADGQPGRLGWFDPPDWTPTVLEEELFCPHSLQLGDLTGDGSLDIYVAEMGLGENNSPRHLLFANHGDGTFERRRIKTPVPTHEAKVVDVDGDGHLDIIGKSYTPNHHVDVWYNVP